jgi:hypothetical protein
MTSYIKVYLFPDSSKNILDNNLLDQIQKDTETKIKYTHKKYDSFFSINGKFENVHKARIILQDIEKNLYREAYLNHYYKETDL